MRNWIVRIKGEVTKDIPVVAEDMDSALECAHSLFSVSAVNSSEKYVEEVLGVRQVDDENFEFKTLLTEAERGPWDPRFRSVLDLPPHTENDDEIRCVVVWQDDENPTDVGVEAAPLQHIRDGDFNGPRYRGAVWMSVMGAAPFLFAESEMRGEAEEEPDEEKE